MLGYVYTSFCRTEQQEAETQMLSRLQKGNAVVWVFLCRKQSALEGQKTQLHLESP